MRFSPFFPPAALVLLLSLAACAGKVEGTLAGDGAAALSLKVALEPGTAVLLQSLKSFLAGPEGGGGGGEPSPVLDGEAIARSMSGGPGLSSVTLRNTGPASLEGELRLRHTGDFLAAGGRRPVLYTDGPEGGRLAFSLDRETAPDFLALLSPEVSYYLEVLQAPAVTGEDLSREEYLDMLTVLPSGTVVAREVASSSIFLSLELPRPVKTCLGGTFEGRRAAFSLPLLDILILDKPLLYAVTW
jgi:hypothetical protein